MNTLKKAWETLKAIVEEFTPNEFVSACWYVACSVDAANAVEMNMTPTNPNNNGKNNYEDGQTHAEGQCGTSGNQVVITDASGVATGMYEINSQTGVKNLVCTLYTDSTYKTQRSYSSVKSNSYIYWTTQLSNGTTWYHQGQVNGVNAVHPNRS